MEGARRCARVFAALAATMAIAGCDVVNNPAPIPSFTVTPSSPVVGESVTLDAFETQHRIPGTRWEWDVNGDGEGDQAYDGSGGVEIQASFDAPGTYEVGLAASNITSTETGFMHVYGFTSRTVVVRPADPAPPPPANRPPVAGFETDADPGYTEVAVAFDASASADPDGRIAKYEWDFDGDGEFDRATTTADTRFAYDRAGVYKARLRVTDDGGGTAEKVAAVPVELGPPPSGVRAAGRSGTSTSLLMDGEMVDQGDGFMTNASMTQVGIRARGEMVFRNLPRPLPAKRDAEWRARFSVQRRGEQSQRVAAEGYLVVGFGSRDRLCMSGRLAGAYGEPALGRLAILGGTGAVRRAGGTFDVAVPPSALGAKGMRLGGTLRLRQGRRARALPPPCRALIRALAR